MREEGRKKKALKSAFLFRPGIFVFILELLKLLYFLLGRNTTFSLVKWREKACIWGFCGLDESLKKFPLPLQQLERSGLLAMVSDFNIN